MTSLSSWIQKGRDARAYLRDLWAWAAGRSLRPSAYTKFLIINRLRCQTHSRVFIETGTFYGETSRRAAAVFDRVITIELEAGLAKRAAESLRDLPHVEVLQGDVIDSLPSVLGRPDVREALVFLDGHYSGVGTAHGTMEEPAVEALRLLAGAQDRLNCIIVDDFRCFGVEPGFPTKSQLLQCAESMFSNKQFTVEVVWDQLRIVRRAAEIR